MENEKCDLHLDGAIISSCGSVYQGVAALFAAYYVYEVEYGRRCSNFLYFVQMEILGISDGKKLPIVCQRFLNRV